MILIVLSSKLPEIVRKFSALLVLLLFSAHCFAESTARSWVDSAEPSFIISGTFEDCEAQEILNVLNVDPRLSSLNNYYSYLSKNSVSEIVSRHAVEDGSRDRIEGNLVEDSNKFSGFLTLVSVLAGCNNLWGDYRFYDVMWRGVGGNEMSWLDVEFCGPEGCLISDLFISPDPAATFHSYFLSSFYTHKNSTNADASVPSPDKTALFFFPPFGEQVNSIDLYLSLNKDVESISDTKLTQYLVSIRDIHDFAINGVEIGESTKQILGLQEGFTQQEAITLLELMFPAEYRYEFYNLRNEKVTTTVQQSFIYKVVNNQLEILATIDLAGDKKIFVTKTGTSVILIEVSGVLSNQTVFDFNISTKKYYQLVMNELFLKKLLNEITVQ